MGGSRKKQTVGYKYFLGEHMIMCHGPIDAVTRFEVGSKIAWAGYQDQNGTVTIDKPELFGGESREGGIEGSLNVEFGGPTQGQNDYLQTQLGTNIPAFRGVFGIVLRKMYLGMNPYLKAWEIRAQRIHVTNSDGDVQWYDAKSAILVIPSGNSGPYKTQNINIDAVSNAGKTSLLPGDLAARGIQITADNVTDAIVAKAWLGGSYTAYSVWGIPAYSGPGTGSSHRLAVLRQGESTVTQFNLTGQPEAGAGFDGYDAARQAFIDQYQQGAIMTGATTYYYGITDEPYTDNTGGMSLTLEFYEDIYWDMNPAHIIRECLTNAEWGMGYAEADIDDASFTAVADTLYNEALGISLLWDRQIPLEDFISEIVRHIDASLYVSRTTGLFVLKLIRNDYTVGSLLTLDPSNIIKVSNPSRPSFGELSNSVTVNYWDSQRAEDASVTVADTAMEQMQGGPIGTTIQYPGFTTARNATIAAQRDLLALSSARLSCTIYTSSVAKDLNIGDVFKFTWPKWYVQDIVMRVTGLAFADGKSGQIRITCMQDTFDTPAVTVVTQIANQWVDPVQPPIPSIWQMAVEAPYLELVQQLGQATVDSNLATNNEIGYVLGAAVKEGFAINARLNTDAGSGYADVGTVDFCPFAQLTMDITADQTVIYFTNERALDDVIPGDFFQIGDDVNMEICRIDAIDTTLGTFTIGRGALDTTPRPHYANDPIFFWENYAGYDETEYVLSEMVNVKITPVNNSGLVALADAVEMSVTLDQRAYRPYPPGQFKINSTYYAGYYAPGTLTVTWVDRDRLQQTSGTIYDHTAAAIGPEASTTYRMRCYLDEVIDQTTEPATSGATWTPSADGLARIEVDSKRDGVYSLQTALHEFIYTATSGKLFEDSSVIWPAFEDNDIHVMED